MLSQLSEPYFKAYHRLFEKGKDAKKTITTARFLRI